MILGFYTIDIFDNVYQNIKPHFETKTPCIKIHGVKTILKLHFLYLQV